MTTSIGEKIIAAIAQGSLVDVANAWSGKPGPYHDHIYVWSQSAAEQLEAVVAAHIEEQVRIRINEEKRRELQSKVNDHIQKIYGPHSINDTIAPPTP